MPKITRRIRNRKNKTIKKGGATLENPLIVEQSIQQPNKEGHKEEEHKERKGIVESTLQSATDLGLKAFGLERVEKKQEQAENVGSDAFNMASGLLDKASSTVIQNVNEVLDSNAVQETAKESAQETADIVGKLAENFNDTMNDPKIKAEVDEAIKNAGEISEVVLEAAEPSIAKVTESLEKNAPKVISAAGVGLTKVALDVAGEIPVLGLAVNFFRGLNDASKAVSAATAATSEAIEVGSDAFVETTEKVKEGLKELEEQKKLSQQISDRTNQSINEFITGGATKTRRRLFKKKHKSKRVRFAI